MGKSMLLKPSEFMELMQSKVRLILEKGGKRGVVGEVRTWNEKRYIKTAKGWRPQKKAPSHVSSTVTTPPPVDALSTKMKQAMQRDRIKSKFDEVLRTVERIRGVDPVEADNLLRNSQTFLKRGDEGMMQRMLETARRVENEGGDSLRTNTPLSGLSEKQQRINTQRELKAKRAENKRLYQEQSGQKIAEAATVRSVGEALRTEVQKLDLRKVPVDGFKYSQKDNAVAVLYDTPREYRHPDEYFQGGEEGMRRDSGYQAWKQAEHRILLVIRDFRAKYPQLKFYTAGGISGGDWEEL
jgi:hypothetical protein